MILEFPTIIRLEVEKIDGKVIREIPIEYIFLVPNSGALAGKFSYWMGSIKFRRYYNGEYLLIRDTHFDRAVLLDLNMNVIYYFDEHEYEYYFSGKIDIVSKHYRYNFRNIKKVSVIVPNIQLPTFKDKVNFEKEVNSNLLSLF